MKNPKKPTREQRKLIEYYGMDAHDWFVVKSTSEQLEIVHRFSDKTKRVLPKGD